MAETYDELFGVEAEPEKMTPSVPERKDGQSVSQTVDDEDNTAGDDDMSVDSYDYSSDDDEGEGSLRLVIRDMPEDMLHRPRMQRQEVDNEVNADGTEPLFPGYRGPISNPKVYEAEIDALEEKPWRRPSENLRDYFNYGFNEETWKLYCHKQRLLRQERVPWAEIDQKFAEELRRNNVPNQQMFDIRMRQRKDIQESIAEDSEATLLMSASGAQGRRDDTMPFPPNAGPPRMAPPGAFPFPMGAPPMPGMMKISKEQLDTMKKHMQQMQAMGGFRGGPMGASQGKPPQFSNQMQMMNQQQQSDPMRPFPPPPPEVPRNPGDRSSEPSSRGDDEVREGNRERRESSGSHKGGRYDNSGRHSSGSRRSRDRDRNRHSDDRRRSRDYSNRR